MFLTSVWTETKTVVMEFCFTYWFQHLKYTLLYQSVKYCRYSERALLRGIVSFWNFHPAYTLRNVPVQFPLNQCNQFLIRERF